MKRAAGVVAALVAFGFLVGTGASEPVWQQLADTPTERQEVSYVSLGGKIYLAGGNNLAHERYDPASDDWESVAPLPAEFDGVDHVHGVAVGGKIVYIGGLKEWKSEFPFPMIDAVAVYDPDSDEFESGNPMPTPRSAGGVAAWRGLVIYAGGLGPNGSVARVDAYDPIADEWIQLADMPRPRDHFQAAVVGDELYAIGGRDTFEDEGIETEEIAPVDVLDLPSSPASLEDASWRKDVTSLPTPRGGHGVATVGDCIYAIGGEGAPGNQVTGATEVYDTETGAWHHLAPMWTPRHGIEAAVVGQTIYIAGGGEEEEEFAPTDAHEALDVSAYGPCATAPEGGPPPGPTAPAPTAAGKSAPALQLLAVRPNRLLLRDGEPTGRGLRFVLVLRGAATVRLSLQRKAKSAWRPVSWRLQRAFPSGRSVVRFNGRAGGRPLVPGRYRLAATVGAEPRLQAPFRVLR